MERNEGHVVIDSNVAKAVVLVVAILTAGGAELAVSQATASPSDQGLNRIPDVARIEPDTRAEVVLLEAGNL